MVDKNGAAYLAASFASHANVAAVATQYVAWINTKVTVETAINSLLAAANVSNDPDAVLVQAGTYYAQFENDPPTVVSVAPTSGAAAGGTAVTITGTNLTGATGVTLGAVAATSVVVVNDTHITCVTGVHGAGAVTVAVTTPAGTGSTAAAYTYV
jgi:hypothetical protein